MDYIRIKKISQTDFDGIVEAAGGVRIDLQTAETSADYKLNEAIIELKLIEEEGFEKAPRQAKLAALFKAQQPNRPVVVLDPAGLDPGQFRDYYNIVAGPIKTQVKSAARHLEATAQRYTPSPTRVLVIINLGYTALAADEFASVCLKCVRNDTTKIDFVVCGGIYLHSDKFDNYLLPRFDLHPVNLDRPFPSFDALLKAWHAFEERLATSMVTEPPLPQVRGQSRRTEDIRQKYCFLRDRPFLRPFLSSISGTPRHGEVHRSPGGAPGRESPVCSQQMLDGHVEQPGQPDDHFTPWQLSGAFPVSECALGHTDLVGQLLLSEAFLRAEMVKPGSVTIAARVRFPTHLRADAKSWGRFTLTFTKRLVIVGQLLAAGCRHAVAALRPRNKVGPKARSA